MLDDKQVKVTNDRSQAWIKLSSAKAAGAALGLGAGAATQYFSGLWYLSVPLAIVIYIAITYRFKRETIRADQAYEAVFGRQTGPNPAKDGFVNRNL